MSFTNFRGKNKNKIRADFFSRDSKTIQARHYLGLPAVACLCVEEGIKSGLIDPKRTLVTAIERRRALVPKIEKRLRQLKVARFNVMYGEASDLVIEDPVDLAYLDFCDQPKVSTSEWIRKLPFTPNARIGLTFSWARQQKKSDFGKMIEGKVKLPRSTPPSLYFNLTRQAHNPNLDIVTRYGRRCMGPRWRNTMMIRYCDSAPIVFFRTEE